MYEYIKGIVEHKTSQYIVVEANGIGYKVYTALSTINKLQDLCTDVKIYTHLHVREDAMILYGFLTQDELSIFELLISVSGVGPKAALSIISEVPASKFALAVITEDVNLFTKAPGIGKKTAQRIILELKDKLKKSGVAEGHLQAIEDSGMGGLASDKVSEAVSALMVLGYSSSEANKAVCAVCSEDAALEDIIMQALKNLSRS